jgi:NADH-quinone oxidoreductase subunit H
MSAAAWAVIPAAAVVAAGAGTAAVLDAAVVAGARPARAIALPAIEAARLLRQRRRAVVGSDTPLRTAGCVLPLLVAGLMALVVPFGGPSLLTLSVGVVWFNAADVVLWSAWWLVGWGSNGVFGLVGGYRFLAQAMAYELPLMFSLAAPAVAAGSLSTDAVVAAQHDLWFAVQMPVALVVFLGCAAGFAAWGPFGHPAGADVGGGVGSELSGIDRLLLITGRYAVLAVAAAMGAVLFLGGPDGPVLPGWVWSAVKSVMLLGVLVALRRLPALPAERIMRAAWLVVLPVTLAQLLVVAIIASAGGG